MKHKKLAVAAAGAAVLAPVATVATTGTASAAKDTRCPGSMEYYGQGARVVGQAWVNGCHWRAVVTCTGGTAYSSYTVAPNGTSAGTNGYSDYADCWANGLGTLVSASYDSLVK